MIDLFLVTPVWVINCVLLFNFFPFIPAHSFLILFFYSISWLLFFILSGLSDAVIVSWLVKYQSFFFFPNAETVMTDVALVMGFILFLFCVADLGLLCREENMGCFSLFSLSRSSYFINHRSVTRSKKMIQQCIFFTDIYLLVICMFFWLFNLFFVYCFFVEGKQDSR